MTKVDKGEGGLKNARLWLKSIKYVSLTGNKKGEWSVKNTQKQAQIFLFTHLRFVFNVSLIQDYMYFFSFL